MSRRPADPRFAPALRRLRLEREMSLRDLAKLAVYGKSYLHELETGLKPPTLDVAARLDIALDAGGELVALARGGTEVAEADDDEVGAAELARRVDASDVSGQTLDRAAAEAEDAMATGLLVASNYWRVAECRPRRRARRHRRGTPTARRVRDVPAAPGRPAAPPSPRTPADR